MSSRSTSRARQYGRGSPARRRWRRPVPAGSDRPRVRSEGPPHDRARGVRRRPRPAWLALRVLGAMTPAPSLLSAVRTVGAAVVVVVSQRGVTRRAAIESLAGVDAVPGVRAFYAGDAFVAASTRRDVPGIPRGGRGPGGRAAGVRPDADPFEPERGALGRDPDDRLRVAGAAEQRRVLPRGEDQGRWTSRSSCTHRRTYAPLGSYRLALPDGFGPGSAGIGARARRPLPVAGAVRGIRVDQQTGEGVRPLPRHPEAPRRGRRPRVAPGCASPSRRSSASRRRRRARSDPRASRRAPDPPAPGLGDPHRRPGGSATRAPGPPRGAAGRSRATPAAGRTARRRRLRSPASPPRGPETHPSRR